jgi:hypothetical protein
MSHKIASSSLLMVTVYEVLTALRIVLRMEGVKCR